MNRLRLFAKESTTVPMGMSWYLADLAEARGKQALFAHPAAQRSKTLRAHAWIENAVSSNRGEGMPAG